MSGVEEARISHPEGIIIYFFLEYTSVVKRGQIYFDRVAPLQVYSFVTFTISNNEQCFVLDDHTLGVDWCQLLVWIMQLNAMSDLVPGA